MCGHQPDSLIGRQNAWLTSPSTSITNTIEVVYGTRRTMSTRGCKDCRNDVDGTCSLPGVLTFDTHPPRTVNRLRPPGSTVAERPPLPG
jgi:hypothetical protein